MIETIDPTKFDAIHGSSRGDVAEVHRDALDVADDRLQLINSARGAAALRSSRDAHEWRFRGHEATARRSAANVGKPPFSNKIARLPAG